MTGYLLGILVVVVGVALSIALHEIGHLVPAKRFGIKCTQYMVGFGPTLWSRRVGETEYGLKAVPLGGYVRMLGMFPPRSGETALRESSTGRWSLMIEQARNESYLEVRPEDRDRLFYQRGVAKRVVVMLGGPAMNLVIAAVLLTVMVSGIGVSSPNTSVSQVSACVPAATATAQTPCPAGAPASAAAQAGLRPGDTVVSIDGRSVTSWDQLAGAIQAAPGQQLQLQVRRNGRLLDLQVTPSPVTRTVSGQATTLGFLGMTPATDVVRQSPAVVPGALGRGIVAVGGILVHLPQRLYQVGQAAFGHAPRSADGPISVVGLGRLSADVGAGTTQSGPMDWRGKLLFWLGLIVSLNLALFVFNLVPLLPLDGGHVAGALWESVRRAVARLRHRPDPGPVDVARALPVAYVVASLLIGMSALLIYADIVNPVKA